MGLFEDRLAKRLRDPEFAAAYAAADLELRSLWSVEAATNVEVFQPACAIANGYSINTQPNVGWASVVSPFQFSFGGPSSKQVSAGSPLAGVGAA
jgi:hypothetical protein